MEKEARNSIQRATQSVRVLLETEFAEQMEGLFDIGLDGTIAEDPGGHLDGSQRVLRAKLVAAIEHEKAGGITAAEAVGSYLREAAFTALNRFGALKMLEARDLVQECISKGYQSSGFREFSGLAPGLLGLSADRSYRLYIESLFDEIGCEVRVLFDRRDPASLLWPRRQALHEVLRILNDPELAAVWDEDETIGWTFQYFNSDEERRQMRAESSAPRNGRELAVRNQFFTPRYVVQFLTDNTLGRIWYEMRQGNTQLRDLEYLACRSGEVFLGEEEEAPAAVCVGGDGPIQKESIKRPNYVRFRAKRDPRDMRVLDPACGSGHFLLYAFDLFETIYEEAWTDDSPPTSVASGRTLRADYPDVESLRSALPGLILRYNLNGIDIDPRCAQIASLGLWLRAQRAFSDLCVERAARPPITKTNIVVAESMPGESELRREFVASLSEPLGRLVDCVFERMELGGETGTLLRIEADIRETMRDVLGEHGELFQASDQERWQRAEEEMLTALQEYSERAANGRALQRKLFAEDATRGLGFIDLCSKRYQLVLMNPPFGAFAEGVRTWARARWPITKNDMYAAFVERGIELLEPKGRLGAITSRTGFFLSSFKRWREDVILKRAPPMVVADLGHGVMDDAMVEAAAYCLELAE